VVADIAKLTVGREEYYTRELATDHEQYLSGHGESPGRWYGAGATTLGLHGEASLAGFQAMFEGRNPTTGELLGRPHGRNAVPAFDVVLRPTKSVSVLYGLGDPATGRAVLAAHHAGLAEAVGYLDEHLGARRGHGGVQHVAGQGLLAVGFDHRTSREGDPLLHTHLVIVNRVQGPDGRWTALDGRDLYRHRLAADAIYRATYQRELTRTLGVEWTTADGHGNRELQGVPEGLVRSFSKRTDQIDAELDRLVAEGRERTPRLVKWTVQATRKPKQQEAPDTLYDRWRQEAAERGVDPDTLVREVTGRTVNRDQDQTVSEAVAGQLLDRLAGPDGLTGHASTFTRPEVLVALGTGLAGAGRSELEELADRFLAERAVSVVTDRGPGGAPLVHPRPLGRRTATGDQRHQPRRRAGGRGLPSGGARCPGRASDRRSGSAGNGSGPVPGWPRGRPGGGAGRDGQDLRPGHRPPCLAAGRLPAAGGGPDRDRHHEPARRGVRGGGHL
jgi:conjugative relaxase-like TrwC/TraI family protein